MKKLEKKIEEYEKLLDSDNLDEVSTDKIITELDAIITELENTLGGQLEDLQNNTDADE
jgi:hypothetical protein